MTAKQTQYLVIGILLSVLIAAGSYFFFIKGQLADASKSNIAKDLANSTTYALNTRLVELESKDKEIDSATKQYNALAAQFPEDFELSQWLSMVTKTARESGVTLTQLEPSTPQVGSGSGADAAAAAATPVPVTPATPAPGTDPAAAAAADPNAAIDVGFSGVNLSAEGTEAQVRAFVKALANMQRPLLIDTLAYTGVTNDNAKATVAISGKTFLLRRLLTPDETVKLQQQADAAAAAAGASPAASPAATPSATPAG